MRRYEHDIGRFAPEERGRSQIGCRIPLSRSLAPKATNRVVAMEVEVSFERSTTQWESKPRLGLGMFAPPFGPSDPMRCASGVHDGPLFSRTEFPIEASRAFGCIGTGQNAANGIENAEPGLSSHVGGDRASSQNERGNQEVAMRRRIDPWGPTERPGDCVGI